jgi:hypothetical protein
VKRGPEPKESARRIEAKGRERREGETLNGRPLRMNGNGIKFLTGFKPKSSGSSDLHSERAEVRTESLLSMFINF